MNFKKDCWQRQQVPPLNTWDEYTWGIKLYNYSSDNFMKYCYENHVAIIYNSWTQSTLFSLHGKQLIYGFCVDIVLHRCLSKD